MKTMKKAYEDYLQRRNILMQDSHAQFWFEQEKRYVHPFRIFGNIYYVGDNWVCVHIIDTGDGLLMIDAGNVGATAMLINSIWEIGLDPKNVKWIILSHGHVDHIGAAWFFKRMFGTRLLMGEPDAINFKEKPELSAIQDAGQLQDSLFMVDEVIRDGDVKQFGNTLIHFFLVPGHTDGCVAAFFDVSDGVSFKRAGYYGGFGFNTLQKDYLLEIGDNTFNHRKMYLNSLRHVREQKVDIFLGNHTENNHLLEKRKQMLMGCSKNPFINSSEWKEYLDKKRDALMLFMNDPKNK
ncbi:MAG: MBL fold metallo-hydrolase [Spirochaetia bacterium]|jgi:metallo-beta-lactamase class B|nr:MBL fold metallo-hydrolase [Spirochaetia bacterium]